MPEKTLRRAKSMAATKGISVKRLVTEAIEDKLSQCTTPPKVNDPTWVKLHGAFAKTKAMRAETRRIQNLIDAEFEGIDVETRK